MLNLEYMVIVSLPNKLVPSSNQNCILNLTWCKLSFSLSRVNKWRETYKDFTLNGPWHCFFFWGKNLGRQMCFCSVISTKFVAFWEKVLQFLNFTKLRIIIINPWHLGLLLKCHIFRPPPKQKTLNLPSKYISYLYLLL